MKRLLPLAVMSLVALMGAGTSSARPELYYVKLKRIDARSIERVARLGFDIAGVDLDAGEFTVLTDDAGVRQLMRFRSVPVLTSTVMVPVLDSQYLKPADVEKRLKDAARDYPSLAALQVIGKSGEGRDMFAIRLTDRFFITEHDKPVLLIDAMHHAREVMTPEVALDIVDYLTKNYATDAKVKEWLRLNEVWVVPQVNPDGNDTVWTSNNMWRKNTTGGYGVDINRNYDYAWNACNGSSGNRFDEQFRGPSAGSESETQVLMALGRQILPTINISFHSFSEIVIFPYGCPGAKPPAAQRPVIESVGRELANRMVKDSGSGKYRPGYSYELLYPVDGGSIDWFAGELGALAYVIELNAQSLGFQPSYAQWRDSTVKRARAAWQYALDRLAGPSLRVQGTPGSVIRLFNKKGELVQSKQVDSKGWTHFILFPGEYQVDSVDDRAPIRTVTVGNATTILEP